MSDKPKKLLLVVVILAALAINWILVLKFFGYMKNTMIYGVSFNTEYANYLGLDTKPSFAKILDDWHFKYIRLSAQWDLIEKTKGHYDWKDLDWMMNEAAKRNVKIVLAVGHKTPRWPECHFPAWTDITSHSNHQSDLLNFMTIVVMRYKNHPALEIWQVENEPFLGFGTCQPISTKSLKEEIALVKKLDPNHRTMVTDSGELSLWRRTAKQADFFGTTMYRVVWSKAIGYWSYDWIFPPIAYTARLWLNGRDINTAYITELQAEPWIPDKPLADTPLEEQFKSMSLKRLKSNVNFAARTGMPRSYLWGAEWWLWLETRGVHEFSDYIKQLKKF
ncbi:MAG: Uncharacterized protein G01um101413_686 [Parcubacteria group bacterium Gr01-1014_13]|nr:MAG: Uncharacterized protein G01um101413_686 [Parcubacteria group bacterium Gr01-1014_13]